MNNQKVIQKPELPIGRYKITFSSLSQSELPEYSGSAWRGAFGHALRDSFCKTRQPDCNDCRLRYECVYSYIFETPPPGDTEMMRLYTSVPHPFVLRLAEEPRTTFKKGETTQLEFILIGHANDYLTHVMHALAVAAKKGISNSQFETQKIEQYSLLDKEGWQTLDILNGLIDRQEPAIPVTPEVPEKIIVDIKQPTHLTSNGKRVIAKEFCFSDLFRPLLRRISMLQYFHSGEKLDIDFKGIINHSKQVKIKDISLKEFHWQRYSSRQKNKVPMGGIIGKFELDRSEIEPFFPYLHLGQYIHAGKGTSMGQGQYTLKFI